MKIFKKPDAFACFAVVGTNMMDFPHINIVYDIPNRKIYLNRAADQAANVIQVRFTLDEVRPPHNRFLARG